MVNTATDRSPERAREDYLKLIYLLQQRGPVRAAQLARRLGLSRASVSKFRRLLARERLVEPAKARTDGFALTRKGRLRAEAIVRRHRLVETWLHRSLGISLERVHVEAERIEHTISDSVADALARFLGRPETDPHGHRIPYRSRLQRTTADVTLLDVGRGDRFDVTSIEDRDSRVVRALSAKRLLPGVGGRVVDATTDRLRLRIGARSVAIPLRLAACVRCRVLGRRA